MDMCTDNLIIIVIIIFFRLHTISINYIMLFFYYLTHM